MRWTWKKHDVHICKTVSDLREVLDVVAGEIPIHCGFDTGVVVIVQEQLDFDDKPTYRYKVALEQNDGSLTTE